MPTNTNVSSQNHGAAMHAVGSFVTTSAAAAAATFTAGFVPRVIRLHNVTDRISDEWFQGMDENALYAAIIGINAKLDADATVTDTNYGTLTNPASASQADLRTSIIAMTTKLDADAGVTDTNYTALWTPAITPNFTGNAPIPSTFAQLKAALTGITAKLDADAGVTDTNYGSLWNVVAPALHTVAAGTRTIDVTNGILNNRDGTFTVSATTMVASKTFCWEAFS